MGLSDRYLSRFGLYVGGLSAVAELVGGQGKLRHCTN